MARPKGSVNKPRRRLLQIIQEHYPDYHPVLEMAKIANDPNADDAVRFNANREVAKYVEPQLRAVDLTDGDGGPVKMVVEWAKSSA